MTSEFGLVVRWNGANNVQVDIPFTYWNRTCGLCGTFDDDPNNDFTTPDRLLVSMASCEYMYDSQLLMPNLVGMGNQSF